MSILIALLGVSNINGMVTNELIYPNARRLDTTLLSFVNDDEMSAKDNGEIEYVQTDSLRRPSKAQFAGVRFIEQDDIKFNDELYTHNNITGLGNHGFLIEDYKPDYSGYRRNIKDPHVVQELVKVLGGEEDEAKAKEAGEGNPDKEAEELAKKITA